MYETRHPEERDRSGIPDRSATPLDPNYVQAAAESVAERHARTMSPKFTEYTLDRMDAVLLKALVAGGEPAKAAMGEVRFSFCEWLVDIWHDDGRGNSALYNEVCRELRDMS